MSATAPVVITEEQKWWRSPKRLEVFRLLIEGTSIQAIAEDLDKSLLSIQQIVSNPFFLRRLEGFLSKILFNFQVNKVMAVNEVFKLYWDIIVGKKVIEGFPPKEASAHLIKILALKEGNSPQIINPKQYNLIMNIFKTTTSSKTATKDLSKEFGFKDLQLPEDEGPKANTKLDKGSGDNDKQGSEDRV